MADGGYALPAVSNPDGRIYVCVPIPDERAHRIAFAGQILALSRWWTWARDDDQSGAAAAATWWPIFQDVMGQLNERHADCGSTGTTVPCEQNTSETIIMGGGGGVTGDCLETECEMSPLVMLHLGGKDYLAEVCCGQETILYEQNGGPAIKSPTSGEIVVPGSKDTKTVESGPAWEPVPETYLDCYAAKAVPYLLERAAGYIETMFSLALVGLDLATSYDEGANALLIVEDMVSGEADSVLDVIRNFDIGDVGDAIASSAVEDEMIAQWDHTGPINRLKLISWVASAPWMVNNTVIKPLLLYWATNSIIWGYNDQLGIYAAECESGQTLEDVVGDVTGEYGTVTSGGKLYKWWVDPTTQVLDQSGVKTYTEPAGLIPAGETIEGFFWRWTPNGASADGAYTEMTDFFRSHQPVVAGDGYDGCRSFDAVVQTVARSVWPGMAALDEKPGAASAGYRPGKIELNGGGLIAPLNGVLYIGRGVAV